MEDNSSEITGMKKTHSRPVTLLIRFVKEKPLGTVGAVITLILLIIGIFANFIAPYGMNGVAAGPYLVPPSAKFLLGTDNLGRDILSRMIFGARISVIVGLAGTTICVILSTVIGILCGYIGGAFDMIVQRVVDAWMCIPSLILMMILISVVNPSMWHLIIVMGLSFGITSSRIVRSAVIGIKGNVYLQAAEGIGSSQFRIIAKHILPNIMAPLIILFSTMMPVVILTEASLSFLGFGVPPPAPSWGGMLGGSARLFMLQAPWMALWPGLALTIVVYGVNMFGDALRDILDPRLRGGVGRYGVKMKQSAVKKSSIQKI